MIGNVAAAAGRPVAAARVTAIQWVVCAVAAMGFAFDLYEVLLMPLIVRPLLIDLGGLKVGTPAFNLWTGLLFYVPAATGGLFGLLGGYLADRLGRRRVLVWSILLYGVSACAAGLATSLPVFLVLRCLTFIGVSVELVAAIAWVAELFPDATQREWALGYTQAFSGLGGLLVTGAYFLAVTYAADFPAIAGGHQAWRYTLISGLIPAIPLVLIRPWLPDSPIWLARQSQPMPPRPSFRALFAADLRQTTLVTMVIVACSYAAAYGAIQHVPRVVAGLPGMAAVSAAAREQTISGVQLIQEIGHLAGRLAFALVAAGIASQKRLLRIFQIPALVTFPVLFFVVAPHAPQLLGIAVFVATFFMVGQFTFWGNYLPRVYPTHLRATGESFALNVGGRIIGIFAAVVTTQAANVAPGPSPAIKLAYAAGAVALVVYIVGTIASRWLPQPPDGALPD